MGVTHFRGTSVSTSSHPTPQPVLPGPEAASPLFEQKSAAIWQKHKIPLLFRYILDFSEYLLLTLKENFSYILKLLT
jgi:hypothetical protein